MYDLERYLNVRSAYGASFAPDGELAFLHDASGGSTPRHRPMFADNGRADRESGQKRGFRKHYSGKVPSRGQ